MTKQYMVVEHFKEGCFDAVYDRFKKNGRMLPHGLVYIDSWVSKGHNTCYQLMETANEDLFDQWTGKWDDLVDFEIVPLD